MTQQLLVEHLQTHQVLYCTLCMRQFEGATAWKRHVAKSHPDRQFVCSHCDCVFLTKEDADQHVTDVHLSTVVADVTGGDANDVTASPFVPADVMAPNALQLQDDVIVAVDDTAGVMEGVVTSHVETGAMSLQDEDSSEVLMSSAGAPSPSQN